MRRSDNRSKEYRDPKDFLSKDRLKDLERKRREWRIEQERRREHEKRKAKMIQEWEAKRARELEAKKQRRRSKSRSRSASPAGSRRRDRSKSAEKGRTHSSSGVPVMSERCDTSSSNNTPLFKGSEGNKINVSELKKITVNIHRNLSKTEETSELLRNITSPDEIILKRRAGEGSKPIFEREELKAKEKSIVDIPEQRTVVARNDLETDNKRSIVRRSRSLSSERRCRHSSRHTSRHDRASRSHGESHDRIHSYDRARTSGDRYRDSKYSTRRTSSRERTRDSRSRRSPDRARDARSGSHRDSAHREYQDYDDHSHRRRAEPDRRLATLPYAEPVPFPMYYDNLVRPVMMNPMMMMRPPLPVMRGRMPPMTMPFRPPLRPRFAGPEMFRMNGLPIQRYNRMF
ncbi:female-specific protein transformer-like isoform X2 [Diachasmimorpha longicaudata]|uniref:female-specific protein transformer-like isoform X2 n=1 Tax=Diachasmimorpha longicaudata TaxID=58733 RepID=UPI0030B902A2